MGFLYQRAVHQCHTVTAVYYQEALQKMIAHLKKKKKKSYKKVEEILLLHDKTRPHVVHSVTDFLVKQGVRIVPHRPYSPDLHHATSGYS